MLYKEKKWKNANKSVKMKISGKKYVFLSHVPRHSTQKIRFLGKKVCSVSREQTHRQTHRHTWKWIQRILFQGFRIFSFNLPSNDRSNIWSDHDETAIAIAVYIFFYLDVEWSMKQFDCQENMQENEAVDEWPVTN